jgi:hypothetical protein
MFVRAFAFSTVRYMGFHVRPPVYFFNRVNKRNSRLQDRLGVCFFTVLTNEICACKFVRAFAFSTVAVYAILSLSARLLFQQC